MHILLLEDDPPTAEALRAGFTRSGFEVTTAASAGDALAAVARTRFGAVILDVMVPGGSGYDVLADLRARGDDVPVLILTARDRVPERVDGLERGADDYLVKPFAFAELMARLRALLRRPARRVEPFRLDGLDIDLLHRRVLAHGRHVDLTRVEFDILLALAEARGDAVTRRDLLATVWGYRFEPGTNVVDVHVARLRRKLESAGAASAIRTVRGIGYALDA
ncbi:MAG: response regulator transcription factor [Deltaproteobacteria bacterium]|nr:MAG: response regulator transcription factor [Deltaproteobacteria bacterium]